MPCLDNSNTNTKKLKEKKSHVLRVMCQVSHHNSCVTSYVSHVMCHMSPVTPDTTTTTDPPPANSLTMLVCEYPKARYLYKCKKIIKLFQERKKIPFANISDSLFDQKSPVPWEAVFPGGDDIWQTDIA